MLFGYAARFFKKKKNYWNIPGTRHRQRTISTISARWQNDLLRFTYPSKTIFFLHTSFNDTSILLGVIEVHSERVFFLD